MVTTAVVSLFLLAMAAVRSPAAAQSCPASYRQKNPQHTACKPRNSWCKIKVSGVDSVQRALILRLHNEFRSVTALGRLPGFRSAADMQELLWDDELEYVAQAHANLCTTPDGDLKHDNITDRFTNRFPKTGQNLAWEGQSNYIEGSNWTWVMDGWFTQEYGLYPWYNVPNFTPIKGVKIGHFTQIVWAQTRYVGCGYVYYNVDANVPFPHMKHYACNYGPTGNYIGEPIYRIGLTCSACPESTRCNRATGLCDGSSGNPPHNRPPTRPTPTSPRLPPETYRPASRYPPPTLPRLPPETYRPAPRYPPPTPPRQPPWTYRPAPRYPQPTPPRLPPETYRPAPRYPPPTPPRQPPWTYRPAPRYTQPTPPRGHPPPQPPGQYCTPCPCLPSTPYRYPTPATRYPRYRYPLPYTTRRRYPPYAQDQAPMRYPLTYDPQLGDGLPRCKEVEGYKPGLPGQLACVEDSGNGGLLSVDNSYGRHDGCPGRDAAVWLYFVAGTVTSLAAALLLGAFLVFWRLISSADHA